MKLFIIKCSFAAPHFFDPVNVKPDQGQDGDNGKRWSRNWEKHCVTTYEGYSEEERCALGTKEAVVEGIGCVEAEN